MGKGSAPARRLPSQPAPLLLTHSALTLLQLRGGLVRITGADVLLRIHLVDPLVYPLTPARAVTVQSLETLLWPTPWGIIATKLVGRDEAGIPQTLSMAGCHIPTESCGESPGCVHRQMLDAGYATSGSALATALDEVRPNYSVDLETDWTAQTLHYVYKGSNGKVRFQRVRQLFDGLYVWGNETQCVSDAGGGCYRHPLVSNGVAPQVHCPAQMWRYVPPARAIPRALLGEMSDVRDVERLRKGEPLRLLEGQIQLSAGRLLRLRDNGDSVNLFDIYDETCALCPPDRALRCTTHAAFWPFAARLRVSSPAEIAARRPRLAGTTPPPIER